MTDFEEIQKSMSNTLHWARFLIELKNNELFQKLVISFGFDEAFKIYQWHIITLEKTIYDYIANKATSPLILRKEDI